MKLTQCKVPPDTLFLARILDDLNLLLWSFSGGASEANKPKSIAEDFIEKERELMSFSSGADFERKRAEILKRITEQENAKKR